MDGLTFKLCSFHFDVQPVVQLTPSDFDSQTNGLKPALRAQFRVIPSLVEIPFFVSMLRNVGIQFEAIVSEGSKTLM